MEEMNELFYRDEYAREFDAEVISCQKGEKGVRSRPFRYRFLSGRRWTAG